MRNLFSFMPKPKTPKIRTIKADTTTLVITEHHDPVLTEVTIYDGDTRLIEYARHKDYTVAHLLHDDGTLEDSILKEN